MKKSPQGTLQIPEIRGSCRTGLHLFRAGTQFKTTREVGEVHSKADNPRLGKAAKESSVARRFDAPVKWRNTCLSIRSIYEQAMIRLIARGMTTPDTGVCA